ncbi:hypothetical protein LXL04_025013 [Taraxacum kok-saghyz]
MTDGTDIGGVGTVKAKTRNRKKGTSGIKMDQLQKSTKSSAIAISKWASTESHNFAYFCSKYR